MSSAAAIGAYEIGELSQPGAAFEQGTAAYVLAHAALGCAAGVASGMGCEGGATSAIITSLLVNATEGAASLTSTQRAEIVGLATLLGGTGALLGGVSAIGGATSAQNEALNNSTLDHETEDEKEHSELKKLLDAEKARLGETPVTQNEDGTVTASGSAVLGAMGNTGTVKVGAAASKSAATSTTLINGVSVTNRASGEVYTGAVDLQPTLDRIASGGASISANDGTVFQNRPVGGIQLLPDQAADYYREYVVPTPGIKGPGPQRLVTGQGGEIYYTPDHYQSFIPVKN